MKKITLLFALILSIGLNAQTIFNNPVSIGNSSTAPTRDLDVHNKNGYATLQSWSEDSTKYAGVYAQGNNLGYYVGLTMAGSNFSVPYTYYKPNAGVLDLSTPDAAIINGYSNGSIVFGVGSYSVSSERFKINTNGCNVTGTLGINNIQVATKNDVVFVNDFWHSPTISTLSNITYHFNQSFVGVSSASGGTGKTYLEWDCTLTGFDLNSYVAGTLGSNTNISYYLRVNNSYDILLTSSGKLNNTQQTITANNLNVNLNAGDYVEVKVIVPILSPAAGQVSEQLKLKLKRR